ncbi:nucleoside phosphorylase [Paracholeplasma manati]|uniref:nucleoside phosphorylase n=1 Tax=Paracholeplasma manati TaxID=591373 RepID=UPI0024087C77|nr:nucleoside phosphorylase [Paracholeplasma manati]MDG0889459.1 nucleoside phosphorylase [Paracholeplasma manati]
MPYPILEFDDHDDVFIKPYFNVQDLPKVENLIITFFKEVVNELLENKAIDVYMHLKGENDYTFYKFVNDDTLIFHGGIGGPLCGGMMEEAIAMGIKRILFCGGGGILKQMPVGHCIVIDSAIRDEGTSYHYAKPSREMVVDPNIVNILDQGLNRLNVPHVVGKTWTTDAFYRETKDRVQRRREEGAILVEMEQASLIAIAQFRKVKYGAICYAGDDLTSDVWDSRQWKSRQSVRSLLVSVCQELVKTI